MYQKRKKIIPNIRIRNNLFNLESFTIGETDNNNGEESAEHPDKSIQCLLPMTAWKF